MQAKSLGWVYWIYTEFLQYQLWNFFHQTRWIGQSTVWKRDLWHSVLHSRSPSVCVSLLHHGQGFISGHWQLEGEGWGRGRGYSHSSSAKQNWPAGRDCYKEVSSSFFWDNKNPQLIVKRRSRHIFSLHYSEEAEALAKRLKLRFYRASVKEDLNVTEGELLKTQTADLVKHF